MPGRASRGRVADGAGRSPKNGVTTGWSSVIASIDDVHARARDAALTRGRAGRRSQSSPVIGRRPWGVTWSSTRRPSRSPGPGVGPVADDGPGYVAGLRRSHAMRRRDAPAARRPPRGRCRATAGTPEPAAPARARAALGSSRPSSRRSGRVSVTPSSVCGLASAARRAARAQACAPAARPPISARRPPGPAPSPSRRAASDPAPRRVRCRVPRPCASGSRPWSRGRRRGSSPGSGWRRATAAAPTGAGSGRRAARSSSAGGTICP